MARSGIWGHLLSVLLAACVVSAKLRGVLPDLVDKYVPHNSEFRCLDGSKVVPFSQVNDDYCDCPDGSDEPGTSACPNGVFYCRNRGHEPKLLASAFVDDGVCDCCDGTDELEDCKNTCIEKNAAVRESLAEKVQQYKAALQKRQQYVQSAQQKRDEMRARAAGIDAEIQAAQQRLARLEAEEAAAKEAANEDAEQGAAGNEAQEAPADSSEAHAVSETQQVSSEVRAQEEHEEEESAEERGRRIASQWTHDPEAAAPSGQEEAPGAAAQLSEAGQHLEDPNYEGLPGEGPAPGAEDAEGATGGKEEGGLLGRVKSGARAAVAKLQSLLQGKKEGGDDAGTQYANDHPSVYHNQHPTEHQPEPEISPAQRASQELQALLEEQQTLTKQLGYDYGPDAAWLTLVGKCTNAHEPQYTYRLCMFDRAAQVDNNGGYETSLGSWKGFEKAYTEAVFEGGDWCHNAPARSMRARIECGDDERAWGASEPSTCVYVASMSTPLACTQEALAQLEQQHARLVEEERALAQEIEQEAAEVAAVKQQQQQQQQQRDEL